MARVLALVAELSDLERRATAGKALAEHLGADDLLIFSPDDEVGALLPAPGFLQTLPQGRSWGRFLGQCVDEGRAEAELPYPDAATGVLARGIALRGGAVLVLLGGHPRDDLVAPAVEALPLLTAAFRAERRAMAGAGHAVAAVASARQAEKLVARLTQLQGELQEALRDLNEASRLKDDFLATLSHELRTPLNAIVGWAHVLQSGDVDRDTAAKAVETIRRSAQAQNQLISDMLDVSRIVAGKLRLDFEPTDLPAVIHAALDTVRPAAAAKGVDLVQELDPSASRVLGDPDRLQQVMWNLLSNAIKFTPAGGCVRISLEPLATDVLTTVEDDGPGIEADFLPHVFDRFRQADSSPSRRHGGLGLGLAIVRHLVELHGGTVEARNREGGPGAAFQVRLPRHRVPDNPTAPDLVGAAPAGPAPDPEDASSLANLKILVVEDQPDALEMVTTILGRRGAGVVTAQSANEGLDALERERPDILVADIEMPGEDGYSLIRKVRLLPRDRGGLIPAVALTAYASPRDRAKALAAGSDVHVVKPVQPDELVAVIAGLPRPIASRTGRRTGRA
jgi:signal transduction histidine kinase/ActR/RegA family two-component response regulator